MKRILALWLPNWSIQRIHRARPELAGRPLVLCAEGPRGKRVAACCDAAGSRGIRPEMPVAEAASLAPEFAVAAHDPAADRRALVKLAAGCERFSPTVGIEEADEPETLLLDVTGLAHLFGGEERLAEQIQEFCRRQGYDHRIAVADTVGMAWAAAHFSHTAVPPHTHVVLLPPGDPALLDRLPVESLRLAGDAADTLRALGIELVGELRQLPRAGLSSRFGAELLRRLDQATGAAAEVITAIHPHEPRAVAWSLDHPTADRESLGAVISQLLERLSRTLTAQDQGVLELCCAFGCTGGQQVSVSLRVFQPTVSVRQLQELLDLRLEHVTLAGEVERVHLRAVQCGRLTVRQRELFAKEVPLDSFPLAVLVNRLAGRLGAECVVCPQLAASAVPERAFRYVPAIDCPTRRQKVSALPGPRPLLLYPRPVPMELVATVPDGPPQYVWLEGHRQRVDTWWGPERIESHWWRGPSVRRDYYRVDTAAGSRLWLFRRLADGRWFLHGEFA